MCSGLNLGLPSLAILEDFGTSVTFIILLWNGINAVFVKRNAQLIHNISVISVIIASKGVYPLDIR